MTAGLPKKKKSGLIAKTGIICRTISIWLSGFFILAFLYIPLNAESPVNKDPDADQTYKQIKKNSPEDHEFLKKQALPKIDAVEEEESPALKEKNKHNLEFKQEESDESPVEKIRKEKKEQREKEEKAAIEKVKADNKGKNTGEKGKKSGKNVKNPWDFQVSYDLKDKAKIKVMIMDEQGNPVRKYIVHPDEHGAKKGKNDAVIWDGKDAFGNNLPEGEYKAVVIAEYETPEKTKGKKADDQEQSEVKEFKFKK